MKTLIIAAALSGTTICAAAAEPPADALRQGALELANSQLDAIYAGAANSESSSEAAASDSSGSESTAAGVESEAIRMIRGLLAQNGQTVSAKGTAKSTSNSKYSK
jgi:type IV secretory pathway TrbL component